MHRTQSTRQQERPIASPRVPSWVAQHVVALNRWCFESTFAAVSLPAIEDDDSVEFRIGEIVMLAVARAMLIALLVLATSQLLAAPADDAAAVFAKWKAAYDANDNVAVAKLYTPDAI